VVQLDKALRYKPEVASSIPDGVNRIFYYGNGVDSASYRNKSHEYNLGVKSGRCVRLQPCNIQVTTV
jgi:hypothetical protein